MAEKMFNEAKVMGKVKDLVNNEIHILENEERMQTWQTLLSDGSTLSTVKQLIAVYRELHAKEAKKPKSQFADFTFKYFSSLRLVFSESVISKSDGRREDVNAIFNFLGHSVFLFGQTIESETKEVTTTTTTLTPSVTPETKRGLLSLGGGCMGEIYKVNKRRRKNTSLSRVQQTIAETLYRLTFKFKMTVSEKQSDDVPVGIKIRDRSGGLFIPKMTFLPFFRATIDAIMQYATEESFQKFGKGILKVCMVEVANTVTLWTEFNRTCFDVVPTESEDNRKLYFNELLRKMVHARLGEFVSAYTAKQAENSGKRLKGGQTLRDELFSKTSREGVRSKRKAVSVRSNPKGLGTVAKKQKVILSMRSDGSDQPATCSAGSSMLRPKRRRVRSRLLDDFIE